MNEEIKEYINRQHVYNWQIAKELGIHESVFSRWFREELTEEQKSKIIDAVERIKRIEKK